MVRIRATYTPRAASGQAARPVGSLRPGAGRCDRFGVRIVYPWNRTTEGKLERSGSGAWRPSEAREAQDADLVARARNGSEVAFAELVRRYNDLLTRHAQRMLRQNDAAEDVVQAAWIKAFRRLDQCRDPERFGAWVFRIAANACKDALKAERRQVVSLESLGELEGSGAGPGESMLRAELGRRIVAALHELPPDQREAFLLKHLEGWSYEDMSRALGVKVSALKMRVHRAREELQRLLLEVPR